jgi:hypothetical protein
MRNNAGHCKEDLTKLIRTLCYENLHRMSLGFLVVGPKAISVIYGELKV